MEGFANFLCKKAWVDDGSIYSSVYTLNTPDVVLTFYPLGSRNLTREKQKWCSITLLIIVTLPSNFPV